MALTKIDDRGLKTPIDLLDNEKIRFGTGNDLELYHNSSHSYIDHTGTGDLWLRSTPSGGDIYAVTANNGCFVVQNASGAVQFISCSTGSVELYEDGVKKFETTSTGIAVTGRGDFTQASSPALHVGNTDYYFKLGQWASSSSPVIDAIGDTTSIIFGINGSEVGRFAGDEFRLGDSKKLALGASQDFHIYHNGTNNYIKSANDNQDILIQSSKDLYLATGDGSTGIHTFLYAADNAGVELRYDNSKKFETRSNGISIHGNQIDLKRSSTTDQESIFYYGSSYLDIETREATGIRLKTNKQDRFNITSGGHVNIGGDYTQSTYQTQITGDLLLQKTVSAYDHPQIELYASNNSAHGGAIKFSAMYGNKYQIAKIRAQGGSGSPNASGGSLHFYTGDGTEKVRFKANGDVDIKDGNLIVASGHGIDFSATSDASGMSSELLDSYEEGTWTPVINKSGDSGAVSGYTNQVGRYVIVGKQLWISFYVYKSSGSFGSQSNPWYISGLPVAVRHGATSAYQFIPCGYNVINSTNVDQSTTQNRWQSNNINGAQTLTLYGTGNTNNWTSGSIEFSGTGVLEID